MSTHLNRLKVTQSDKNRTTTLHLQRRDSFGHLVEEIQFTVLNSTFERALKDAEITVPVASRLKAFAELHHEMEELREAQKALEQKVGMT